MAAPTSAAAGRRLARCALGCLLAAALVLSQPCLAAGDGQAPGPTGGRAAGGAGGGAAAAASAGASASGQPLWQRYEEMFPSDRLVPVVTTMRGHEVAYQIPLRPTALLFIAPGCSHAAHDWWPASEACPQCLGLPEEVAHTQQALARGYAVLVMSSKNAHGDMCMDWRSNHRDAERIVGDVRRQHPQLAALPLFGLGVSVGGGFMAKLAARLPMAGVVSEVLGPEPGPWDLDKYVYGLPPIVFVSMDQDPAMAARISADAARLRARGGAVATVRVAPRVVGPSFFSDRSSHVSPETSARVVQSLHEIGMLDERGYVTVDPRHTKRPWVKQLLGLVPELNGGMREDHSHVWEEMNLAYSCHEIIADFATAAFAWMESGGKADFAELVAKLGAPGHTGLVADAAGAIPPPTAPALATPPHARHAPDTEAAQQVYAVHEAAVKAAEAKSQPTAAAAAEEEVVPAHPVGSVALPEDLQGQQDRQEAARQPHASLGLPEGQPGDAAGRVSVRMQNATAPRLELQPLQPSHPQRSIGANDSLPSGGPQAQGQPAHSSSAASAVLGDAGRQGAAGDALLQYVTPAVVLGGIAGAAVAAALAFTACRFVRQPRGFDALPLTEPRGPHGLPLKPPPELPVSSGARLPPIPENVQAAARV